jgi:hypothetical protein
MYCCSAIYSKLTASGSLSHTCALILRSLFHGCSNRLEQLQAVVTALSPLAELRELSLAHNPCSSSTNDNSYSSSAAVADANAADTPRRSSIGSSSSSSCVCWKQRAVAEQLPCVLRFDDVDTDVVSHSTVYVCIISHVYMYVLYCTCMMACVINILCVCCYNCQLRADAVKLHACVASTFCYSNTRYLLLAFLYLSIHCRSALA